MKLRHPWIKTDGGHAGRLFPQNSAEGILQVENEEIIANSKLYQKLKSYD